MNRALVLGTLLTAVLVVFAGCPEPASPDTTPPAEPVRVSRIAPGDGMFSFRLENPNNEEILVQIALTPAEGAMVVINGASTPLSEAISLAATGDAEAIKQIRIIGLVNGTEYTFTVTTFDTNGNSHRVVFSSSRITPLPSITDAPTGLMTTFGDRQIMLTWNDVDGADEYRIFRSIEDDPFLPIETGTPITDNTYLDTGLTNGTRYTYTVRTVNLAGESGDSDSAFATPLPPILSAPENLFVTSGDEQITLTWDSVDDVDEYRIYRAIGSGLPIRLPTTPAILTTTTYLDTGLTNGTRYTYTVRAVNLGGDSEDSDSAFTVPLPPAPNAPENLIATSGDEQVMLTWDAVDGADEYHIFRSSGSASATLVASIPTTLTNHLDTGLTNGTRYTYTVLAVNIGGRSGNSTPAFATPLPPAPNAPENLIATSGDEQVMLTWDAVDGANEYHIFRSNGGRTPTLIITIPAAFTSYLNIDLANGTTYTYTVRADNIRGESGDSTPAFATPLPPLPGVPGNLRVFNRHMEVTIAWNNVDGADEYHIYRAIGSGSPTRLPTTPAVLTANIYVDTGLTNGTTYTYTVQAVNLAGNSGNSIEISATPTYIDDHGDTRGSATIAVPGRTTSGRIGTRSDVDYFRLRINSGQTLRAYTTGSLNTNGAIFSSTAQVASDDNNGTGSNFDVSYSVTTTGAYFIRVGSSSTGDYRLTISLTTTPVDHGNTRSTATAVTNGSRTAGRIDPRTDTDFFSIHVNAGQKLRARTTGSLNTIGAIFSSSGTLLEDDIGHGTGDNFSILYPVTVSGTYFIRVRSFNRSHVGNYTLTVNLR